MNPLNRLRSPTGAAAGGLDILRPFELGKLEEVSFNFDKWLVYKKTTPKDWTGWMLKASDHRNDSESVRSFVINLISCNMGDRMCWGMVTCYGWDLLRGHPSLSACWKQSKRWWPEVQTKSFKDPEGPSSASSSGQRRQTTSRGLKKQKQILKNLMTANVYRCRWHPEACCCNVD